MAVGDEARIILDPAPDYVVPASISFVAADAQFAQKDSNWARRFGREPRASSMPIFMDLSNGTPVAILPESDKNRVRPLLPKRYADGGPVRDRWPSNLRVRP